MHEADELDLFCKSPPDLYGKGLHFPMSDFPKSAYMVPALLGSAYTTISKIGVFVLNLTSRRALSLFHCHSSPEGQAE